MTPIEIAARDGDLKYIQDHIGEVHVPDRCYSALRWALQNSHQEIAELLLEKDNTDCLHLISESAMHGKLFHLLKGKIIISKQCNAIFLNLCSKSPGSKEQRDNILTFIKNSHIDQYNKEMLKAIIKHNFTPAFKKKHLSFMTRVEFTEIITNPDAFEKLLIIAERRQLNEKITQSPINGRVIKV